MRTMASQITSLTIVYSAVYSGADQRKHQSSASLAFVRGIHQWPVNSPHKWPVTRKNFHLMTSSWKMPCPNAVQSRIHTHTRILMGFYGYILGTSAVSRFRPIIAPVWMSMAQGSQTLKIINVNICQNLILHLQYNSIVIYIIVHWKVISSKFLKSHNVFSNRS